MIVLDASVAAAWFFADERGPYAMEAKERVGAEPTIVPAIFPSELLNALLVARRRGRISDDHLREATGAISRLPVAVQSPSWPAATEIELAQRYGLSAYDAVYLALAVAHRATLLTLDDRLREAAQAEGVA